MSIEGGEASEGRTFVVALVPVMNSVCMTRAHTDRDVLHALSDCPDVISGTGPGNKRQFRGSVVGASWLILGPRSLLYGA